MTIDVFIQSLKKTSPPSGISLLLKALWYDGKGDWEGSHNIVQEIKSRDASWIHAYLHRKEGDNWNANYWYRRAGRKMPNQTLAEEWRAISEELLNAL